jgi:hypothetical protein
MRSADLSAKAKADGAYSSRNTFDRARKLAGVQTGRAGGKGWWVWLPGQDRPAESQRDYLGDEEADRPTPVHLPQHPMSPPIDVISIGVGNPGDRPTPDPDMREHYPRFARSCVLASDVAKFNAVPPSKRLHQNQKPPHLLPLDLDDILDDFDPAEDPGDCVLWTGTIDKDEYGVFRAGGKQYRAHRWLWTLRHGSIPPGLEMAHHSGCPHRHCVVHVTPETKKKNLAERRKPVAPIQREAEREASRQRRDDIRAARFREEQRAYWSMSQDQRDQRQAEYRAAMDREYGYG